MPRRKTRLRWDFSEKVPRCQSGSDGCAAISPRSTSASNVTLSITFPSRRSRSDVDGLDRGFYEGYERVGLVRGSFATSDACRDLRQRDDGVFRL